MRHKLALIGAVALFVLALGATSASARNFSISHATLWRANWSPLSFRNGSTTIAACNVTLEGSFHYTTIAKTPEALIGLVTKASVGAPCATGSATILTENLPWHIRYRGFEGTLPSITGIRDAIVGMRFRIRENVFGIECLATAEASHPALAIISLEAGAGNRNVTGINADGNARIPCSIIEGNFVGSATLTETGREAGTRLLTRLI